MRSGDSLWKLQERYGVPWKRIQRANNLSNTVIRIGQRLRIPGVASTSTTNTASWSGNSSSTTAPVSWSASGNSGGVSTVADSKANLRAGLAKLIQERGSTPVPAPTSTQVYRVRSGDSLSRIANRFGVSLGTLRSMNGIPSHKSTIYVGQRLKINRAGHPRRLTLRYHQPMRATEAEVTVLARIIKGECPPSMSFEGKVSVAAVLLNRVRRNDGVFSRDRSITRAAHRPKQFSCYNADKRSQLYWGHVPSWAYEVARTALAGVDPTQGSTHYYNPYLVSPSWAKRFNAVVQLGRDRRDTHLFFHTRTLVRRGADKPNWAY